MFALLAGGDALLRTRFLSSANRARRQFMPEDSGEGGDLVIQGAERAEAEPRSRGTFGQVHFVDGVAIKFLQGEPKNIRQEYLLGKAAGDIDVGPKVYGYLAFTEGVGAILMERFEGDLHDMPQGAANAMEQQLPQLISKLADSGSRACMDLKPGNVLYRRDAGGITLRLSDWDPAFCASGDPANPEGDRVLKKLAMAVLLSATIDAHLQLRCEGRCFMDAFIGEQIEWLRANGLSSPEEILAQMENVYPQLDLGERNSMRRLLRISSEHYLPDTPLQSLLSASPPSMGDDMDVQSPRAPSAPPSDMAVQSEDLRREEGLRALSQVFREQRDEEEREEIARRNAEAVAGAKLDAIARGHARAIPEARRRARQVEAERRREREREERERQEREEREREAREREEREAAAREAAAREARQAVCPSRGKEPMECNSLPPDDRREVWKKNNRTFHPDKNPGCVEDSQEKFKRARELCRK